MAKSLKHRTRKMRKRVGKGLGASKQKTPKKKTPEKTVRDVFDEFDDAAHETMIKSALEALKEDNAKKNEVRRTRK